MFKKRKSKEIEKSFSKYLSKDSIAEILETFDNTKSEKILDEFNKKAELKTYEIIVLYTKEYDVQKWLEKVIPKLKANNYVISSFYGNFLFADRKCENGFDESIIKSILDDKTKMAVLIKKTQMINMGTNDVLRYNPKFHFNDDFLTLFGKLNYGEYMLIPDADDLPQD